MQKQQGDPRGSPDANGAGGGTNGNGPVIHEDGSVTTSVRDSLASRTTTVVAVGGEADDDASTKGVVSPSSDDGKKSATESDLNINEIPTIKISTESDREREHAQMREDGLTLNGDAKEDEEEHEESREIKEPEAATQGLERPELAASGDNSEGHEDSPNPAQDGFSFSNKRLCERWLDNLFMVLYEVRHTSFPYPSPCVS